MKGDAMKLLVSDESVLADIMESVVHRNAMEVFRTDGIGRKPQQVNSPKEKTKYDHERIMKNEIRQANKATKRLKARKVTP